MSTTRLTQDIYDDERLEPSVSSEEGTGASYAMAFPDPATLDPGVDIFVWVAEPGTYPHEVIPVAESSIVVEGEGEVDIEGHGTYPLSPGTLCSIPPGVVGEVRVRQRLRALVIAARPSGA